MVARLSVLESFPIQLYSKSSVTINESKLMHHTQLLLSPVSLHRSNAGGYIGYAHKFNKIDRPELHSMHCSGIFSIDKRRSGHMAALFGSVTALSLKEALNCKDKAHSECREYEADPNPTAYYCKHVDNVRRGNE